jgi:CRP-like cAMP-binding protein
LHSFRAAGGLGREEYGGLTRLESHDFGPGQFFGEIALMMDMPRTATIMATQDTLLLVLQKEDFLNFLTAQPHMQPAFHQA